MNTESQQQDQSVNPSNVSNPSMTSRQYSSPPSMMTGGTNPGQPSSMSGMANATATMTITETDDSATSNQNETPVLLLSLAPRPSVRWDESTLDNEGLGRKSSKRCCIFHKQRNFGESSTDSSEEENGDDDNKTVARPKSEKKKVPDYQRFHA